MSKESLTGQEYEELNKFLSLQEKKDILRYREYWSPRVFKLVVCILIFQAVFVIFIGWGWLDFTEYENVISVYLVGSVAQIVGLSIIILKFLFPNQEK